MHQRKVCHMASWIEMRLIGITNVRWKKCLPGCIGGNLVRTFAQFRTHTTERATAPGLVFLDNRFQLTLKGWRNDGDSICLTVRMVLCLSYCLATILENHDSGIARGNIEVEIAPEP